jgi:hypothetical protein
MISNYELIIKCDAFYKMAIALSDLKINPSGMRNDSINLVRKQRQSNVKMKPIEIDIYPGEKPFLSDGRHRLSVAKELGDKTINAIIRYYDEEANVLNIEQTIINI